MGEIDTILLIQDILAKIGFDVKIERNFIDVIAQKKISDRLYKIGFEIKPNLKNNTITDGLNTLKRASKTDVFDKLVLITSSISYNSFANQKIKQLLQTDFPTSYEVINQLDLPKWSENLKTETKSKEESKIIALFQEIYKAAIKEIARNPSELKHLNWLQLEHVIATIFERFGFNVTLTPPSKDGGKDVILECYENGTKKQFIIEIKHWKTRVGQNKVNEFLKVILNEKRNRGLFLSSSGFTKNYCEFIAEIDRPRISFGNHEKIISLCNAYERINEGLLLPLNSFEDFTFSETVTIQ